jgi:hypothetical protein
MDLAIIVGILQVEGAIYVDEVLEAIEDLSTKPTQNLIDYLENS